MLTAGGLTHSECPALLLNACESNGIFVAQGRAMADVISGWTYTLRMPSTQSF